MAKMKQLQEETNTTEETGSAMIAEPTTIDGLAWAPVPMTGAPDGALAVKADVPGGTLLWIKHRDRVDAVLFLPTVRA